MFLASDVLNSSRALLNDTAAQQFTNAFMLPYLNIAIAELNEMAELNNVQVTNATSVPVVVPVGVDNIGGAGGPDLPAGLIEIQQLFERTNGTSDNYQEMTRKNFLPEYEVLINELIYWAWENQIVKFLGALSDRQVRMHYISSRINAVTDATNPISVINAESFLNYRTAALAAEFSGENKTRADSLNGNAGLALDRFLGIDSKGRQAITTRRRPFMGSYKSRGGF